MYEIIDVIRDYLFVRLRLRNVQTSETRDWEYWDDLEEWLCEEYGVKNLKYIMVNKDKCLKDKDSDMSDRTGLIDDIIQQ